MRGRVPARRAQGTEQRGLGGCLVEMEGLRIERAGERDDLLPAEGVRAHIRQLADLAILEEVVRSQRARDTRQVPNALDRLAHSLRTGIDWRGPRIAAPGELVGA